MKSPLDQNLHEVTFREYCVFIKVDTGFDKHCTPLAVFFRKDLADDYVNSLEENNFDLSVSYIVKHNNEEV